MAVVALTGDGAPIRAYVARPRAPGPGIVVLHSAWGLLADYDEICGRLAAAGFLAIAPDMGDGRVASSWAEAEQFARETPSVKLVPAAVTAVNWLKSQPGVGSVALLGFSRGGATALRAAAAGAGEAVVTFYGTPAPAALHGLHVPVLGHFAETDPYEPPDAVAALFASLAQTAIVHPGTEHCFVETTPGTHHAVAAAQAWLSTVAFLRQHLTLG